MTNVAMLSAILASAPALADDGHIWSGANCESSLTSTISSGRRLNSSASTASFSCPVEKDSIDFDIEDDSSHMWALDLSTTGAVTCTLFNYIQTSSIVTIDTVASSYPAGSGNTATFTSSAPIKLAFLGVIDDSSDPYNEANWYHITCSVPGTTATGTSGIASYYVEEND
jgi:hypothetical protein